MSRVVLYVRLQQAIRVLIIICEHDVTTITLLLSVNYYGSDFAARIARQGAGDEYDIVIESPHSKFTLHNIIMTCLRINRKLVL